MSVSSVIGQLCSFISLAYCETNFPYYFNHRLLIFDYDWFSAISVSFYLVVLFIYHNAVKRSISLLLVLRL